MLTIDQLIELEILIDEELERLRSDLIDSEAEREAVSPDKAIGRLSRLDAMQMQEVAKESSRRREQRIHDLESAQRRLDEGEYGRCDSCGGWIGYARLEAHPEATRCERCAG